ncbi:MAG: hypothetical protein WBK91_01870 [Alphaproteobacteria bacterium]
MVEITLNLEPASAPKKTEPQHGWRKAAQECLSYLNKNKEEIIVVGALSTVSGVALQLCLGDGNPVNNFGEFVRMSLQTAAGTILFGNMAKARSIRSLPTPSTIAGIGALALCIGVTTQTSTYQQAKDFLAGDNPQEKTTKIDVPWSDLTRVITRQGEQLTLTVAGNDPAQNTLTCTRIFVAERVVPRSEAQNISALDVDMTKYANHKTGSCDFIESSPVPPKRVIGQKDAAASRRSLDIQ